MTVHVVFCVNTLMCSPGHKPFCSLWMQRHTSLISAAHIAVSSNQVQTGQSYASGLRVTSCFCVVFFCNKRRVFFSPLFVWKAELLHKTAIRYNYIRTSDVKKELPIHRCNVQMLLYLIVIVLFPGYFFSLPRFLQAQMLCRTNSAQDILTIKSQV